eukprot:191646-Rhodomonas_salina.2
MGYDRPSRIAWFFTPVCRCTASGSRPLSPYGDATRCPVLTYATPRTVLRARYALGTEMGYATTRRLCDVRYRDRLCCFQARMAVLRQAMLLPG